MIHAAKPLRVALVSLGALSAFIFCPKTTEAGDRFEVAAWGGLTAPLWEQTFRYSPDPIAIPVPGLSVKQSGEFTLKAKGGSALGGGFGFFPAKALGFEFRIDSVSASVDSASSRYTIDATLPAPLPPYSTTLDLTAEGGASTRSTVTSLNVVLRTTGATRVRVSGGFSRLPDMEATIQETLGLGVVGVTTGGSELRVSTLGLRAKAPTGTVDKLGFNVGLGLGFSIGDRVDLVADVRYFQFPTRTMEWSVDDSRPLSSLEQALLDRVLKSAPSVAFDPVFFQGTVGLAIRF
jgi:opacity protein-like surface antigen